MQLKFNEYVNLFIIQFSCFFSDYGQLKETYLEIAEKTSSSETCALLDEADIDSDEDVDSKMHDLDTEFFGKMKQITVLALLQMHQILWFLLLTFIVHHLGILSLFVQSILKINQPFGGGKARTSQGKMYNMRLHQTYQNIFLVIRGHLVSLVKKGAPIKSEVHCPIIIKKYSQSIGGFDIFCQYTAAYILH